MRRADRLPASNPVSWWGWERRKRKCANCWAICTAAGADIATIGQYLQPTRRNLAVAEYIEPRQFDAYREYGLSLGFKAVFSGPLVRSSYMADEVSEEARALC